MKLKHYFLVLGLGIVLMAGIFIPAGFGHGFLTLEDNTIQTFAVDADFEKDSSGIVNYKDPEIGLRLPVEDIIISDYDKNAN